MREGYVETVNGKIWYVVYGEQRRKTPILVLHGGCLAYHGPPRLLPHYFSVQHPEEIYRRLADREPKLWHASWVKHRSFYYDRMKMAPPVPVSPDSAPMAPP